MRDPIFLALGCLFAGAFVVSGVIGPTLRVGRTADHPEYLDLRRRVGRRVALIGAAVCLLLGLALAFVV